MAKIQLKGRVDGVGAIQEVGENKTKVQFMILFIPGYHDGFEKKGRDQQWCLKALGENVTKLSMTDDLVGKKVEATVFVESQLVEPKDAKGKATSDPFYSVNLTLKEFSILS